MSKRRGMGSSCSTPPTASFAPGIVERGQTMVITRQAFIVGMPESDITGTLGRHTLTAGRKVYSWSTAGDVTKLGTGHVTETLSDDDDGTSPQAAILSNGESGFVTKLPKRVTKTEEFDKHGNSHLSAPIQQQAQWLAERTTDMQDEPLPTIRTVASTPKPAPKVKAVKVPQPRAPKPTPELTPREAQDLIVRRTLSKLGVGTVSVITPKHRRLVLEYVENQKQLAEYTS